MTPAMVPRHLPMEMRGAAFGTLATAAGLGIIIGSLVFRRMTGEAGRAGDFLVGETACLIYAAKTRSLGHVNIKAVKAELLDFVARGE
jgi:hypothetical protein